MNLTGLEKKIEILEKKFSEKPNPRIVLLWENLSYPEWWIFGGIVMLDEIRHRMRTGKLERMERIWKYVSNPEFDMVDNEITQPVGYYEDTDDWLNKATKNVKDAIKNHLRFLVSPELVVLIATLIEIYEQNILSFDEALAKGAKDVESFMKMIPEAEEGCVKDKLFEDLIVLKLPISGRKNERCSKKDSGPRGED